MAEWVFEQLTGAAVRRDPKETQLFKTEQSGEGEYAGTDGLVRELLQNSMDASVGVGPVTVRLALYSSQELPPRKRLVKYFERLVPATRHLDIKVDDHGLPSTSGFLLVEDFGTRGLEGDPLLARDPVKGSGREDFFWFWRNIGRSGKTGDDLGRWGLGKTVYRAASQLGCMLGLTVRQSDRHSLLMGQAVLRIHEFMGKEFVPEGFWCAGQEANTGVPRPIVEEEEINQFRQDWQLRRRADEPGLSVVVPFVSPELKAKDMLQAICVHFFLPIIRGQLIVEIHGPDIKPVCLNAKSLDNCSQLFAWNGPKRTKRHQSPPFAFVRKCLEFEKTAVPSGILGEKTLPRIDETAFTEQALDEMRRKFEEMKLVAIRIRIHLPRRDGFAQTGEMTVFVQKEPHHEASDSYFIREGMTITKLNARAKVKGIQGLVLVEKGPLARLLGDSEGPAHEDWDTSEERPNLSWIKWKGRVSFCRRIIDDIVDYLTPKRTTADFDLLSDIFSIAEPLAPQRGIFPNQRSGVPHGFTSPQQKPKWFRLEGRRRGFRIAHNTSEPIPTRARLKVSVAYDMPSGDPLKSWSPFDFDFRKADELRIERFNLIECEISGNELILMIEHPGFSLSVDGFDEHRDLFVRIDEMDEPDGTRSIES